MPGWWRRGNSENCDNLIDLLISEKELRQNHRVQFQFIEMIHPNRLENDSIMAPVAQEAEIIELDREQLDGIQGGCWTCSYFPWEGGHNICLAEIGIIYYNNYAYSPGDNSP